MIIISEPVLWPEVPVGATLHSALLAAKRMSGIRGSDAARIFLGTPRLNGQVFPPDAGWLASHTVGGRLSPEDFVRNYTPFPFYASFLRRSDEARWLSALCEGDRASARQILPLSTRADRFVADRQRQCRECLREDLGLYGVGHWRVVHQVPAITRCPLHLRPLHDRCGDCGHAFGGRTSFALPGDVCDRCGSSETSGLHSPHFSEGYRSTEELIVRALRGDASELRPASRVRLLDDVIYRRVGIQGLEDVAGLFLASWGVKSMNELSTALGCLASERHVVGYLRGVTTGVPRVLQAAILAFVAQYSNTSEVYASGRDAKAESAATDLFEQPTSRSPDAVLLEAFCTHAAKVGYPIVAARELAAGGGQHSIGVRYASLQTTRKFLAAFPAELLARYEALRVARRYRYVPADLSEARDLIRGRVLEAMRDGCTTRALLLRADGAAYRWARMHDKKWLDQMMPLRRGGPAWRRHEATLERCRVRILALIDEGYCSRSRLHMRASNQVTWARRHDSAWLDRVMPKKRGSGRVVTSKGCLE